MRAGRKRSVMVATALAVASTGLQAACLDDAQVQAMAKGYFEKTPVANPEGLSDADASCTRKKLHALLEQRFGKAIGYKAGLTNPAVQKRFGTDQPVWGRLYQGSLLESGATVEAAFGARPLYEADMLVRVKSDAINRASTPAQVLDAIDQVIPFIELPDLVVQAPPKLNGAGIAAINVGARLGVVGKPIPVPSGEPDRGAMLDALRDMKVTLTDAAGTTLGGGKGSDILDHPLNAVVWLAKALAAEGIALKPGELVSLGSFSALLPPKSDLEVTARYEGLPGAAPVKVGFR